jgi:hypothetical protein
VKISADGTFGFVTFGSVRLVDGDSLLFSETQFPIKDDPVRDIINPGNLLSLRSEMFHNQLYSATAHEDLGFSTYLPRTYLVPVPQALKSTFDVKSTVAGFFFEKSTVVGFFF